LWSRRSFWLPFQKRIIEGYEVKIITGVEPKRFERLVEFLNEHEVVKIVPVKKKEVKDGK
jgi:hypothetical protein